MLNMHDGAMAVQKKPPQKIEGGLAKVHQSRQVLSGIVRAMIRLMAKAFH